MVSLLLLHLLAFLLVLTASVAGPAGVNDVDLFFGTEAGGNVFPGSTRPFGMVKLGVDVIHSENGNAYSGYQPDGRVNGISMLHESGTGGAPQYGVVSQLPWLGDVDISKELTLKRLAPDSASVGSYFLNLTTNNHSIQAELAANRRSGIIEYTFSNADNQPIIMVNGSHHLSAPERPWWTQYFVNGELYYGHGKYFGSSVFKGGWGEQTDWQVFYCGDFDAVPTKVDFFKGNEFVAGPDFVSANKKDGSFGLIFKFSASTRNIKSRIGVSFVSADQACQNIADDFGDSYDVDTTVKTTVDLWNKSVFDRVQVDTNGNKTLATIVASSLYGSHLLPSNRTGEQPGWKEDEIYYDDWFTIWDTFRCLNPFLNIINPTVGAELVQSLINIFHHEGYTPDGRSANQNGRTQGGSNSDIVMADAAIKNVGATSINWADAYLAMKKNAEVAPPYVYDSYSKDSCNKQGRGALRDWLQYGYVTRNYTRSVSRTVEYSYDDFALSVVAKKLHLEKDAAKYLKRSANWQNLWNPRAHHKDLTYRGFLQPKNANGRFNGHKYSPLECGDCYWKEDVYEGKIIEYSWSVPWDIATLKSFIGSNETFSRRLDDMFALFGTSDLADIGNEPSFLTPYLYNYINQNHKTVATLRYLVNTKFGHGPKALPGNSDAGAMQTWYFMAIIGLYPVAGTTTYLLSAPFVPLTILQLENGGEVQITANNLGPNSYYVTGIKLNGKPHLQNWLVHDDLFATGGTLEFTLGPNPVVWETGPVPPSPGHLPTQQ